jgi:tetratricopeptide (TPR) repeat protein
LPARSREAAATPTRAAPADARAASLSPGELAAIGLAALAVRLAHVWQLRASPLFSLLLGDSRGYDDWARRIAGGEWIGTDVFYQAPLYPYVLGVVYATTGHHLLLVRVLQALVGSGSCLLLALAVSRLFSKSTGLVAGLMLALYAPAIFFDGLIQKSVLDVFFICLALWLIAKAAEDTNGLATFALLGVTMGALALTRENALVFILIILAWILWPNQNPNPNREPGTRNPESRLPNPESRLKGAALFFGGLVLVLAPVAARNAYVGGGFYITTSQFGPNFYIGNNPNADGTYQSLRYGRGAPEYERTDATDLAERALGRSLTPGEVSTYWVDKALDFITSQPGAWLRLMARKFALLWNATEMLDTESQETHAEHSLPLRVLGRVGHFGVLVPLALAGALLTWPMRRRLWILHAMTIAYGASVVVFYVFARYRYPLVPLLIPFAAAAAVGVPERIRSIRAADRAVAWTAAGLAAVAVFCNWPILSASTMRAVTESNIGVALQTERRLDEAIDHYRRAIALRPDYAPAYNNLGSALRASGRRDEAVASYQKAIELRPDFAGAHYNLANLLVDEGKPAEAVEQFTDALRTEPASADVHNNLGIALAGVGRLPDAIAEFRSAIALDPKSAKAHRNLGDALSTSGNAREGLASLRRAVALDPADAAIRYDLASALVEATRYDEAIAEFRETLRLNPNFVEAHNNLGIALGSSGRLDEAVDEFRRALALKPDFADAQRNLTIALAGPRQKRD